MSSLFHLLILGKSFRDALECFGNCFRKLLCFCSLFFVHFRYCWRRLWLLLSGVWSISVSTPRLVGEELHHSWFWLGCRCKVSIPILLKICSTYSKVIDVICIWYEVCVRHLLRFLVKTLLSFFYEFGDRECFNWWYWSHFIWFWYFFI